MFSRENGGYYWTRVVVSLTVRNIHGASRNHVSCTNFTRYFLVDDIVRCKRRGSDRMNESTNFPFLFLTSLPLCRCSKLSFSLCSRFMRYFLKVSVCWVNCFVFFGEDERGFVLGNVEFEFEQSNSRNFTCRKSHEFILSSQYFCFFLERMLLGIKLKIILDLSAMFYVFFKSENLFLFLFRAKAV